MSPEFSTINSNNNLRINLPILEAINEAAYQGYKATTERINLEILKIETEIKQIEMPELEEITLSVENLKLFGVDDVFSKPKKIEGIFKSQDILGDLKLKKGTKKGLREDTKGVIFFNYRNDYVNGGVKLESSCEVITTSDSRKRTESNYLNENGTIRGLGLDLKEFFSEERKIQIIFMDDRSPV